MAGTLTNRKKERKRTDGAILILTLHDYDQDSFLPKVAVAFTAATLGTMYADAKLLLSKDYSQVKIGFTALAQFKERVKEDPHKVFIYFEGKEYTLLQLEKASNQLANWLLSHHVQKKDIVCMMLQNHPTFFIALFAISKVGAIPALLNTNLKGKSLEHCVGVTNSKLLLFDPIYEEQVHSIRPLLENQQVKSFAYGEATSINDTSCLSSPMALTSDVLSNYSDEYTDEDRIKDTPESDPAFLIYTSGTTGFPKAAVMQHIKVSYSMTIFSRMVGKKGGYRSYCVLPLYHSSGLVVSSLPTLYGKGSIVLGRKFSTHSFWEDCYHYKVDTFGYIGEFCRYLMNQLPHPLEKKHKIELVYGNGMGRDIWNRFKERFNIPKICEFYAATEAPSSLFNVNTGPLGTGAIGFRGYLSNILYPKSIIVKIDPTTEELLRDSKGMCIQCGLSERGESLTELIPGKTIKFEGYYNNKSATNKKIVHDVISKGDSFFRCGDLLYKDKDGFFYFCDRIGDTFRWKSENVSTTEVAQVLNAYPGMEESSVYGVKVPHHSGNAGMAAIVYRGEMDYTRLYAFLSTQLPRYAIPVFIRRLDSMSITETFKLKKGDYKNQGIRLEVIPESSIFWLQGNTYVPFTKADMIILNTRESKL
ncbi:hypothetical protein BDF14DRAFT_1734405 [Spinellus fusiger]|nr:hypothetical protein BDF14DRAFT_1739079 [Spinellus fusiger]KAI7863221.1 hypothetical protein BDF14DRAFT_1734405 [Spinellus fusiger]